MHKIETLKLRNENLNSKHFLNLPDDTPYGNLNLKWLDVVQRFDSINDLISDLDKYFKIINIKDANVETANFISDFFYKEKFTIEQIFYWLRKSTDELISLLYVLDYHNLNGEYPTNIKIDCIGFLLSSTNFYVDFVNKYNHLLTILNEVTNAYKHSFVNSEVHSYHGVDYPIAYAYSLKRNTTENSPQFYSVAVNDFIIDYCRFLRDIKYLIQIFELED
ncbi:hypothetical protein LPB248_00730 [Flavobacterium sp. LPB0248]|uniref:hypothetical protein n=1 Tax=Flavobacterium sp. LPB0248 TaxID=2614441 RepID=UPI0015A6EA92|nr:hypothetical protein [Flavobacterium sp. LPB0248]QLC64853.1 hypothetical protein LPB248_00730 [Flavobacterium sp. LPB0248]